MAVSQDAQKVITLIESRVMRITLNRTDHRNAVDGQMMQAMARGIEEAEENQCIVIRIDAAGEDFSLGRDHTESPRVGSTKWTKEEWTGFTRGVFGGLGSFSGVSVVEVRGRAYGFGAALTTTADIAIAADDSRLAFDEVPMGFAPRRVMSMLYNRLGERRIKELVLTGRSVTAQEAHIIGIVTELAPSASLRAATDLRVESLLSSQERIVRHAKRYLAELTGMTSPERPGFEGPSTY